MRKNSGFTLIELLAVIIVLVLLGLIVYPAIEKTIKNTRDDLSKSQVTSIENTRMKYSGSDFKFTSQANHLSKLLSLLSECQRQSHHMQRLYKRRRLNDKGEYESNWDVFKSRYDY